VSCEVERAVGKVKEAVFIERVESGDEEEEGEEDGFALKDDDVEEGEDPICDGNR